MSLLPVEMKIQLSEEMSEKLAKRAFSQNVSVGTVIRDALSQYLDGAPVEPGRRGEARKSGRRGRDVSGADESGPARTAPAETVDLDDLKSRFSEAVERASDWDELQERLRESGLDIAPKGGGLVVMQAGTGTELCKASDLGFAYSRLIRRYRAGWADHPHTWPAERILADT